MISGCVRYHSFSRPYILQTVHQKIRPLVGELHPGKHLDPDFLSVCRRLLVIGKIKLDLVCIMHCPGIGADVSVQEVVGDEDPVISDLFVKADGIFCRRICALYGNVFRTCTLLFPSHARCRILSSPREISVCSAFPLAVLPGKPCAADFRKPPPGICS